MDLLITLALLPFALYGLFLGASLALAVLQLVFAPVIWLFSSPDKDDDDFDISKYQDRTRDHFN
jgi:hypothetical protein